MSVKVISVKNGSIGEKTGLLKDDIILNADNNEINDMLDYEFYTSKESVVLAVKRDEKIQNFQITKGEYEPLGLDFETYLMDKKHSCKNKCMFCFIDQLPKGMRSNLYFKDDDERLSFIYGNYITLTNLTQHEIDRIIKMNISPINISVHTTNPQLRVEMMKNKNAGDTLKYIDILADAGIKINAQIVLCRGVNDGVELENTLKKLTSLHPNIQSIAMVPFGLTKFREGLCQIEPYDKQTANEILDIADVYIKKMLSQGDESIVHPADEFYLLAERDTPQAESYDDFLQLENGVGMYRKFLDSFSAELKLSKRSWRKRKVDVATGELAYPLIKNSAEQLMKKHKNVDIIVHSIKNNFFGGNVSVAGLVTGADITEQLQGKLQSEKLIIPESMLRDEEDMFIDSVTIDEVQEKLQVKICLAPQTGDGFIKTVLKG